MCMKLNSAPLIVCEVAEGRILFFFTEKGWSLMFSKTQTQEAGGLGKIKKVCWHNLPHPLKL